MEDAGGGRPKRARTDETPPSSSPASADEVDDDVLKMSEVLDAAEVWEPVRKAYMSDLSNHMLVLKSTSGDFSKRQQFIQRLGESVLVHLYNKPEDWDIARRSLVATQPLYEIRIREHLSGPFKDAGTFTLEVQRACSDTARILSARLVTEVGDI
jgi:hypothetical protein